MGAFAAVVLAELHNSGQLSYERDVKRACDYFVQFAEDIGINEGVIRYYTRVKERSAAEALRKVAAYVAGDS